ncbi:MAG: TlpA family protein disulfide reductase [Planctomycetota bacterium]
MRIASVACLASVALALTSAIHAQSSAPGRLQGTVDPATGEPSLRAKGMVDPSAGWTDAERSADAVAKGTAELDACAAAYREAKGLTDRARVRILLPDGEQNETIEMAFAEGGDFDISGGSVRAVCTGGKVAFVPDQPDDRYLGGDLKGSGHSTLVALLGAFPLMAPDLALRQPLEGAKPVHAFLSGPPSEMAVRGFRESGGTRQVLVAGKQTEAVITIDPATHLVRSVRSTLTPEGLPDGAKIGIELELAPAVGAPAKPIAFDPGARRAVANIGELFADDASAPAPQAGTAKVGGPAPVAALKDLDGNTVDLAAMKGKVIVLDFWATWCGPCRKGLPMVDAFAKEMKDDPRVAVFAVNVWEQSAPGEIPKKVRDTFEKLKVTLPVLLDGDAKLISQYGFTGIPATVVIGPDGSLVSKHIGLMPDMGAVLGAEVRKALGTAK